jgi:hypothetical protein
MTGAGFGGGAHRGRSAGASGSGANPSGAAKSRDTRRSAVRFRGGMADRKTDVP